MDIQQRELLRYLRDSFQEEIVTDGSLQSVDGLWDSEPYVEPLQIPLVLNGPICFNTLLGFVTVQNGYMKLEPLRPLPDVPLEEIQDFALDCFNHLGLEQNRTKEISDSVLKLTVKVLKSKNKNN